MYVLHGPTKAITGSAHNSSQTIGNEELSYVNELRCHGHVITADCRGDKDIEKQFRSQNVVGNMLVRFPFAPMEAKIQLFKSYCYLIYGCALWRHSYQYPVTKLTVFRYTSSSVAGYMYYTNIN